VAESLNKNSFPGLPLNWNGTLGFFCVNPVLSLDFSRRGQQRTLTQVERMGWIFLKNLSTSLYPAPPTLD